jgi:phage terminase large subunit-like protein
MVPIMTFIGTYHGKSRRSNLQHMLTSTTEWLENNVKEDDMPDTNKEVKAPDYREVFDMQDWHEVNT